VSFLRSILLPRDRKRPDRYPFDPPAIATLDSIDFRAGVTFFAGGNGTGKSTLLEAVAAGAGSVPVRTEDPRTRETLECAKELAGELKFSWATKARHGFFLREEDFFEYKKGLAGMVSDLEAMVEDYEERLTGMGRHLASSLARGQRRALVERYGEDLTVLSHGESLLQFFRARLTGPGLYLMDEPDTSLSPLSVLALLAFVMEMAVGGSQFIIATHSPILLALPGAQLISFDRTPITEVEYDELEQVVLMREFLRRPEAYLRRL
jgi:predicted ATPase